MTVRYGKMSAVITTIILFTALLLTKIIIGHLYIWAAFNAICLLYGLQFYKNRYQFVEITDQNITISSFIPWNKNVVIHRSDIMNVKSKINSNFGMVCFIEKVNGTNTIKLNTYYSESKKISAALSEY